MATLGLGLGSSHYWDSGRCRATAVEAQNSGLKWDKFG
jgi:hypothetical protein